MNPHTHPGAGFSLVEVTLALGIAAFCLIALSGLLPVGVHSNQNAAAETAAASALSSVVADLRATPSTSTTSRLYGITFGTGKVLYLDGDGRSVDAANPSANVRYRITIAFHSNPAGAFAPTFASLKATWPALADPAITTPAGLVETFVSFDRH